MDTDRSWYELETDPSVTVTEDPPYIVYDDGDQEYIFDTDEKQFIEEPDQDTITETTATYSFEGITPQGLRNEFDQRTAYQFVPTDPLEPSYTYINQSSKIEVTITPREVRFRQYEKSNDPINEDLREGLGLERVALGEDGIVRYETALDDIAHEEERFWNAVGNTDKHREDVIS